MSPTADGRLSGGHSVGRRALARFRRFGVPTAPGARKESTPDHSVSRIGAASRGEAVPDYRKFRGETSLERHVRHSVFKDRHGADGPLSVKWEGLNQGQA